MWLFATFCGSVTVCTVVKAWATARVDVAHEHARVHLEVHRINVEAQHGPLTVPDWMTNGGES